MINDDRIDTYFKSLKLSDFKPHEITLHLKTPAALYDPLHLDGLLAKAVVENALDGQPLESSAEPYYLPLPLKQAWTADSGLPLWHSTDFQPLETDTVESVFWHKRTVSPDFLPTTRAGKPMNIRATQGALKEYRIPLPLHTCLKWGKRPSRAMPMPSGSCSVRSPLSGKSGRKATDWWTSWELKPIKTFSFFDDEDKPLRPIPTPFLPDYPITDVAFTSWTPPYWSPAAMLLCHSPRSILRSKRKEK